ncbi:hypothetical protein L208DRAFT_1257083 [Tricholoma matsutake]|nr:hypothetical protein L208DRAFT_1257083 [Tricholoma matsutake 945]
MPPKTARLACLPALLTTFSIPSVSWKPDPNMMQQFQQDWSVTYTIPEEITVQGRTWYSISAYGPKQDYLGTILLPPKYYPIWRRLVYSTLYQEQMYNSWTINTKRLRNKSLNKVEEQMIHLRNNASVRFAQYLVCRRLVLEEFLKIQFDNNLEPVIQSLIEFGIRNSRDWLFDTFDDAKEAGAGYLRLDPTNSKNLKEFEKSYEPGLDKMFPPAQDDEWWDGDFKHFDFHKLFSEIIKHAPVAMANESLEETNWVLACNGMAPNAWHEYSTERIAFFSESFVEFLQQGKS